MVNDLRMFVRVLCTGGAHFGQIRKYEVLMVTGTAVTSLVNHVTRCEPEELESLLYLP